MTAPAGSGTGAVSKRTLAITTVVALVIAAAIVVAFVLPAEYGRDPLGTGRVLGLTRIASPPPRLAAPEPPAPEYKVDAATFVLGPYEFVEYKYHLAQGAAMLFTWSSSATVIHDFHGDPDANPDAPVSHEKQDRRQASAAFTAPFAGIHGWYWENPGAESVTITVTSAGFYTSAVELRSDRSRHVHELKAPDRPAAASK
jgi:hypothetical protein